jgi:hypothetical protein
MKTKPSTMLKKDGLLRVRVINQKNRQNSYELFNAMGGYMQAIEEFNRLILCSIQADGHYNFQLNGIEDGSIITRLKSFLRNAGDDIANKIDTIAMQEITALTNSTQEIKSPQQIIDLAESIENNINGKLNNIDRIEPYIDTVKLAKICMLISDANEKLLSGEKVEIASHGNVIPINTRFRSTVKESHLEAINKIPYRGYDKVKVIRPCNFGGSLWDLKSIITSDTYSAHFHNDCDWLKRYQNGEFTAVTAMHTLNILVEYEKHIIGKTYQIKDAIIISVEVHEDPDGIQTKIFDDLD